MIADRTLTGRGRADGKRRARAFTLIELLVVIALLGVLFTMTGPALVKTRDKARELQCLNNVRNLSIAHLLYSSDHNDRLLPHAVFHKPPPNALVPNAHMTFWPDLLVSYAGDKRAFQCPCMKCNPDVGIGYGMNLTVAGAFLIKSEVFAPHEMEIRNPGQTILFGDAAFVTREKMFLPPAQWEEDTTRPIGSWTIRSPIDPLWNLVPTRLIPRHNGRANVGFVDGHVESLTIEQLGYDKPLGHPKNWWDRR